MKIRYLISILILAMAGISLSAQISLNPSSTNETCAGLSNGSASVFVTGGSPPYKYNWEHDNSSGPSVSKLTAGTYRVTVTDKSGNSSTAEIEVKANPKPVADAGPDIVTCEGEGGKELQGSASGGSAPYYFSWKCDLPNCGLRCVFCKDPVANPTSDATYVLTVTDANGCKSDPDSLRVSVSTKPKVNAGKDLVICPNEKKGVQLRPSLEGFEGELEFEWQPSQGLSDNRILNPVANPDTTTIYTLMVSTANGCTSEKTTIDTNSSVTVHVNPKPLAHAGTDTTICLGDSLRLKGFGTGAGPRYQYEWTPAIGLSNSRLPSPLAFPKKTTKYTLRVSSLGCASSTDNITITVRERPSMAVTETQSICNGERVRLKAKAEDGNSDSAFQYNWWPKERLQFANATTPIAYPYQSSTYFVQAISEKGCKSVIDSVRIIVKPTPMADAGPDQFYCLSGDSLQLKGEVDWERRLKPNGKINMKYSWSPSDDFVNPKVAQPFVYPHETNTYQFTVEYDGCKSEDSVKVTVLPEIVAIATCDTNSICSGDTIHLHASGGSVNAKYSWSPASIVSEKEAVDLLAWPESDSKVVLKVEEGGCSDYDTLEIKVSQRPKADFDESHLHGCVPFAVNFEQKSKGAEFYIWDFGDESTISNESEPMHVFWEPGLYRVMLTVFGEGACSDSALGANVLVIDTAAADFSSLPSEEVTLYLPDAEVQFLDDSRKGIAYIWEFGDGVTSHERSPKHRYEKPGKYYAKLHVLNEEGCVSTLTRGPFVVISPEISVPNIFSPNGDGKNDLFEVSYAGMEDYDIMIRDRWGKVMYKANDIRRPWDGINMIDAKDAPKGVYFYTIRLGERELTGHLTLVR